MSISFNDTSSDKNGLIQICETKLFGSDYGAISSNTKRLATITRGLNGGLSRFSNLAIENDTRWEFHDSNYTTQPEAYTTMSAGQSDYGLSDLHLQIRHVYVKNQDGKKVPLRPVSEYDTAVRGVAIDEWLSEDGMPRYYDIVGRSIKLKPAPSASETTLDGGLYVTYTSSPSYFTDADTTKEAGVPIVFHDYPAIFACKTYANNNNMPKKAKAFKIELQEMEAQIASFYARRNKGDKPQLRSRKRNYV